MPEALEFEVGCRPISGSPNYSVGDDGSVWHFRNGRWNRLKARPVTVSKHRHPPRKGRYLAVRLFPGGKNHLVHLLVLNAFVGPKPGGYESRHLDGDPANNRLSNLCYGTKTDNAEDKRRHGTLLNATNCKLTEGDVHAIRFLADHGMMRTRIAELFGVTLSTVTAAVFYRSWKHV